MPSRNVLSTATSPSLGPWKMPGIGTAEVPCDDADLEIRRPEQVRQALDLAAELEPRRACEVFEEPQVAEEVDKLRAVVGWPEHDGAAEVLRPVVDHPGAEQDAAHRVRDEVDLAGVAALRDRVVDVAEQRLDRHLGRGIGRVHHLVAESGKRLLHEEEGVLGPRQAVEQHDAILRRRCRRRGGKRECGERNAKSPHSVVSSGGDAPAAAPSLAMIAARRSG